MAKRGINIGRDGADLEAMADKLIRDSGDLNGTKLYSEIQLTRQDVRHERADSMERVWASTIKQFESLDDIIIESAWADIKVAAIKLHMNPDTLKMIELRQKKWNYEDIGIRFELSEDAARLRVKRAMKRIMSLPEFGMWETINEMTRCLISDWLRVFGKEMKAREWRGE